MKKLNWIIASSFVLSVVTGCNTIPPYKDPIESNASQLTIKNHYYNPLLVVGYGNTQTCQDMVYFNGTPLIEPDLSKTIKIPAHKEFVFFTGAGKVVSVKTQPNLGVVTEVCQTIFSFVPKENSNYIAEINVNHQENKCIYSLKEIKTSGESETPDSLKFIKYQAPFVASSPQCKNPLNKPSQSDS
ncbi:hypothetical protein [Pseudoalteromonas spongiae]|uniref:hypothetical protein n=1 Tax=Pseudoalteromonas spongiae TaxID=298657 RepID=UPI00110B78BF|nr:hypothetical protein [Pseudoalteromonas spongiae]